MKFDIVFVNPPFDHIEKFEKNAIDISNQYVWMIAKTSHIMNISKFKNIIYFRNMGREVFKERIDICSYLINKDKLIDDSIYVEGHDGKFHVTNDIKLRPSEDIDAWKFARKVTDLDLPSYNNTDTGVILQRLAKIASSGVKCIWSSGGKDDISYGYIDESQQDQLFGLGDHKVFTSVRYHAGVLGEIKYSSPDEGLSYGCIGIILESKDECLKAIEYINSMPVKKLVKGIKLASRNSKTVMGLIPHHSQKDKWFHLYDD